MARGEREASTPASNVAAGRSTDAKVRSESAPVPGHGFASRPVAKSPFEDEATIELPRPMLRPPNAEASGGTPIAELDWLFDVDDDGEEAIKAALKNGRREPTASAEASKTEPAVSPEDSSLDELPTGSPVPTAAVSKPVGTAKLPSPGKASAAGRRGAGTPKKEAVSSSSPDARKDDGVRPKPDLRDESGVGPAADARDGSGVRSPTDARTDSGVRSATDARTDSGARTAADARKDSGVRSATDARTDSGVRSATDARTDSGARTAADARKDAAARMADAGKDSAAPTAARGSSAARTAAPGSSAARMATAGSSPARTPAAGTDSAARTAAAAGKAPAARPVADPRQGSGSRTIADLRKDLESGARPAVDARRDSGARAAADARKDLGSGARTAADVHRDSGARATIDAAARTPDVRDDLGAAPSDARESLDADPTQTRTDTAPQPVVAGPAQADARSPATAAATSNHAVDPLANLGLDEALRSLGSEVRPLRDASGTRRPVTGAQPLVNLPDPHAPDPLLVEPGLPTFDAPTSEPAPTPTTRELVPALRFDPSQPRPAPAVEVEEPRPLEPAAPRRPASLPRPTGMKSKRKDPTDEAPRTNVTAPPPSGVPKGIVPPPAEGTGEPKVLPRTNTAALVALVAADLIQQHERSQRTTEPATPEPSSTTPAVAEPLAMPPAPTAQPDPFPMAAPSGFEQPVVSPSLVDASLSEGDVAPAPRRRGLWIGVAAAGLLAVFGLWRVASSDEAPAVETPIAANEPPRVLGSDVATKGEPSRPEANVPEEQPPRPDPGGGAIAMAEPTEPEPTEAIADAAVEPVEPVPTAKPAATAPAQRSRTPRTNTKKQATKTERKPAEAAPTPAPPKPAAAKPAATSAKDLLAEAKQALGAGKAGTAYDLAQSAYRKTPSTAALTVMVRAACRSKREAAAKSAFEKLPLSQRSGLRAECRQSGIKLGL